MQCYFDICPDKPSSNESNVSLVMTDNPFGGTLKDANSMLTMHALFASGAGAICR
jgi:hypothetical protein